MKKKIKAKRVTSSEKNLEELNPTNTDEISEEMDEETSLINQLSHPGVFRKELLIRFNDLNQLLERIAIAEEKRNEIAEEEYSEDDDDEL